MGTCEGTDVLSRGRLYAYDRFLTFFFGKAAGCIILYVIHPFSVQTYLLSGLMIVASVE
jgi:uncharacterized membrane protein required for colicin V production